MSVRRRFFDTVAGIVLGMWMGSWREQALDALATYAGVAWGEKKAQSIGVCSDLQMDTTGPGLMNGQNSRARLAGATSKHVQPQLEG
jgi:hypothetical protein